MGELPEYIRLAANYWSVDELVRWSASVRGHHMHTPAKLTTELTDQLERFVPRDAPTPTLVQLARRALDSIGRLGDPETWSALALTETERFDWLPTSGGVLRDIAYDLFSPLAYFRLNESALEDQDRWRRCCVVGSDAVVERLSGG